MHRGCNRLIKKSSKSLVKWKREAEAWYRQDSAMFEDFFQVVEANVVWISLLYSCQSVTHTVSSA